MQPKNKEQLSAQSSLEELDLPLHLVEDLYRSGFRVIGDLAHETETEKSLRRISKSRGHMWGVRSVEKLQLALQKAGFEKLPKVIPKEE